MGRLDPPRGARDAVRPPPRALGRVQPLLRHALVRGRRRPADQGGRSAPQRAQDRLRHLQEPALRRRPRRRPHRGLRRRHRRRLRDERAPRPLEAHDPLRRRADRRPEGHRRRAARRAARGVRQRRARRAHRDDHHRDRVLEGRGRVRRPAGHARPRGPDADGRRPGRRRLNAGRGLARPNICSLASGHGGRAAPDLPARLRRARRRPRRRPSRGVELDDARLGRSRARSGCWAATRCSPS